MIPAGEDPEDRDALARAMEGVRPLRDGRERILSSRARPPVRRPPPASVDFACEGEGSSAGFYARDLGRDPLLRLRREKPRDELSIDLHGCKAGDVRRAIERLFEHAAAQGSRRLRIVHGKGLHSTGAPVLGECVRELLLHPPLSRHVAAFTFAPLQESGTGATLVSLRAPSRRSSSRR